MAFDPLNWYRQPAENSIWAKVVDSAFGSYTPCAISTLVISISNLVLIGLCRYRIWLITCNAKAQRFCLSSNYYNYLLAMLAAYCAAQPLLRLLTGNSAFNLNGETGFAPSEITALIVETPDLELNDNTHTLENQAVGLLYQQLRVAPLIGSLMLVLIIHMQTRFVSSFLARGHVFDFFFLKDKYLK